jgi:hypothetical protein
MATLLKVLNNLADIKSAGGVALRVRTQDLRKRQLASQDFGPRIHDIGLPVGHSDLGVGYECLCTHKRRLVPHYFGLSRINTELQETNEHKGECQGNFDPVRCPEINKGLRGLPIALGGFSAERCRGSGGWGALITNSLLRRTCGKVVVVSVGRASWR